MNDNYLWDRTGEPDPEIQKLEELLGELRYQPQPLHIPENITVGRKRSFYLPMTIAAAIIMVAILSALWFQFSRKPTAPTVELKQEAPVALPGVKQPESSPEQKPLIVKDEPKEQKPRRQLNRNLLALNKRPVNRTETLAPRLTQWILQGYAWLDATASSPPGWDLRRCARSLVPFSPNSRSL